MGRGGTRGAGRSRASGPSAGTKRGTGGAVVEGLQIELASARSRSRRHVQVSKKRRPSPEQGGARRKETRSQRTYPTLVGMTDRDLVEEQAEKPEHRSSLRETSMCALVKAAREARSAVDGKPPGPSPERRVLVYEEKNTHQSRRIYGGESRMIRSREGRSVLAEFDARVCQGRGDQSWPNPTRGSAREGGLFLNEFEGTLCFVEGGRGVHAVPRACFWTGGEGN